MREGKKEREREREGEKEKERERERGKERGEGKERERERESEECKKKPTTSLNQSAKTWNLKKKEGERKYLNVFHIFKKLLIRVSGF